MAIDAPPGSPVLTLPALEAFDVGESPGRAWRRFCCPLPACEGKPRDAAHRSLSLETATGFWRCHRCGAGGRLREHWGPPLPRAQARRAALRRAFGLTEPQVVQSAPPGPPSEPAQPTPVRVDAVPIKETAGAAYLEARGIPVALAAAAGVVFARDWYGRPAVLFPLRDQAGAVVAVQGRYVDGGMKPKARTRGMLAAGVSATPGALSADPLVIVEAPIDALSLAVCGVPAIALCGTSWPTWLPKVAAFREVLIGLDADAGGDDATGKLTAALSFGSRAERFRPEGAKDWNEALQLAGADRLRRSLFDRYAAPRYTAVWRRFRRQHGGPPVPVMPHRELEQVIDAADWQGFARELVAWEQGAAPPVVQGPVGL